MTGKKVWFLVVRFVSPARISHGFRSVFGISNVIAGFSPLFALVDTVFRKRTRAEGLLLYAHEAIYLTHPFVRELVPVLRVLQNVEIGCRRGL